jgi:hypothetical protein
MGALPILLFNTTMKRNRTIPTDATLKVINATLKDRSLTFSVLFSALSAKIKIIPTETVIANFKTIKAGKFE